MHYLSLPIDCKCQIRPTEKGGYEIKLYGLPHPYKDDGELILSYTGKSIEEMGVNMGHYFSELLNRDDLDPLAEEIH